VKDSSGTEVQDYSTENRRDERLTREKLVSYRIVCMYGKVDVDGLTQ
jgi:hypothetical protein